ncbi:hypothetical protein OKA05_18270 [Luteolibacter arcticus]|uniref:Tetratricopeptide repeat protein n=1 Tax=Luteolibacter arcticus TaxID=1581411 RepID=A0ABT3GLW5_9BACT|nr:hypothetical protein [Luteolibacter arcticus]MCW1924517.1 hypothetical protein [Luteolibacter arcticus]
MTRTWAFLLCGLMPAMAGEMPEKAEGYHEALRKRPESETLFQRFRDAWLEEKPSADLEAELLSRAEAGEPGAWGILGRERLAAGKDDEALVAFGKAIEAEPAAAWLRLARAKMLLAKKDFAAAEKDALAVPEGDKLRPEALKLAGLAFLRGERVEEALAHWKKAVDTAPGDKGLLEDLTELTRREGRHDLALDFCVKWRDATEDAYGKAMATLKRSELLLASQRVEEAMTELGEVLKVAGDGSWLEREALARAEQTYQRRSDATGWVKQITTWANANPVRLNFRRAQAQALATAGKPGEALEVLGDVLKRTPGDREARWQRIALLERDLKVQQAFDECAALVAEEKSEEAGLRLAELAFRLEKKDEVRKALDAVIAAADPAKRVGLAGLYARYGLPAESEKQWRALAGGESGGQALRDLAKYLRTEGRDKEALEVWKEIGRRDLFQDRIDAAHALAAAGEKEAASKLLEEGRARFSAEAAYEEARAELAIMQERRLDARAIFRELAARAKRPDEMQIAVKGWLRAAEGELEAAAKDLGEGTGDRCLRAALLAESGKPLPALAAGDELERGVRLGLLREHGKWPEVVEMLEASGGSGPLFLSELCDAKFLAGDTAGSLVAARAWRERTPDQPGPWLKEADLLADGGELAAAEALLRRAAARFESDENVARALFAVLEKNRDAAAALAFAWQCHDEAADASGKAGWLRDILRISKDGGRLEDLRERLEERVRRDPASPGPLLALADLAKAKGNTDEELQLVTKAATSAPRDVAVVSRLAALEEQMGRRDRALERFAELARLVPGAESARQLAQAKLRCGDIAGGMRDLQALAGDQGIDIRALEQSVFEMAARGYVEEGIELLSSLDPALVDARLHFMLGRLLEADGSEAKALDHYLKVMTEPDDPAEGRRYGSGREGRNLMMLLSSRDDSSSSPFQQIPVPGSLQEAKMMLPARILQLAMLAGGDAWKRAAAVLPELKSTTPEQWRELKDFAGLGNGAHQIQWWDFIRRFPENPLGPELLFESQQYSACTPEQVAELLKRTPPVPLRLALSLQLVKREIAPQTLEWLQKVDPGAWRDDFAARQLLACTQRLLTTVEQAAEDNPETRAKLERLMAVLAKADLGERMARQLHLLRARQALLAGDAEAFLAAVQQALDATAAAAPEPMEMRRGQEMSMNLTPALTRWKTSKGEAAFESLVDRLPSPVLRCLAGLAGRDEKETVRHRVEKELAALPADSPREVRRELIRLRWQYQDRKTDPQGFEKMLQAAADVESDPRLALEAFAQLMSTRPGVQAGDGPSPEDRRRLEVMAKRVMASNESDRPYAQELAQMFGQRQPAASRPATRWGGRSSGLTYYGYGNSRNSTVLIRRIVALEDRQVASREAADLLESIARGSMEELGMLREPVAAFRKAGLLDEALAKVQLPEDAGLSRRMAMLVLMEAAEKKADARSIVAGIHRMRPWDTRWAVELALLTDEREEAIRLLDEVAGRPDFARKLLEEFFGRGGSDGPGMVEYGRLADWMERPQADRSWLGSATIALGTKSRTNDKAQAKEWSELYQRFAKLALTDPRSAEMAFRSLYSTTRGKDPAAVEDAAWQALLSGAYTLTDLGLGGLTLVQLPEAPAALEWLVIVAKEKGDDVLFSDDLRGRLKAVDPDLEAWIGKLLATQRATELPDLIGDVTVMGSAARGGLALARHEAAMLRAIHLAGREDLLEKLFRENRLQTVSGNVTHVIRESLRAAAKEKTLEKRLLILLEASAGPRKEWNDSNEKLTTATGMIVRSVQNSDSGVFVGVLNSFSLWQLKHQWADPSESLAVLWGGDLRAPRRAKWEDLPGTRLREALLTGFWRRSAVVKDGKPQMIYQWTFQDSIRSVTSQMPGLDLQTFAREVSNNPKASFLDLMRAEAITSDKAFGKRALKLALPELEKLPDGIREGVIDRLTSDLGLVDADDLPKPVANRLRARLKDQSEAKVKKTRARFEALKGAGGLLGGASEAGRLAGEVALEAPELAEEIVTFWRSKQPKVTDQNFNAFALGLFSDCGKDAGEVFLRLRMIDRLWADGVPAWTASGEDPFSTAWGLISWGRLPNPDVWPRFAKLSPRMQVRLLLGAHTHFRAEDINDNDWLKASKEAAKGDALTHHALGWFVEMDQLEDHGKFRSTGIAPLGLLEAMKAAGATPGELTILMEEIFKRLAQLDNAADLMERTPGLLAGIKELPQNTAGEMLEGVFKLWGRVQLQMQESGQAKGEDRWRTAVHPAETAAFLKFVLAKVPGGKLNRHFSSGQVSSVLVVLDDDELIDRWVAAASERFSGDYQMILHCLKKGRIKEALAFLPPPSQSGLSSYSGSPAYSKEMEELAGKLAALDSPEAFRLRVMISMMNDAREADAPVESRVDRIKRLAGEFEKRSAAFSLTDRMALCNDLQLTSKANREHVPALDEFAGEMAAKEFRAVFSGQPRNPVTANVCAAAVKSRFHAGDSSGIEAMALAIRQAPAGAEMDQFVRRWLSITTICFWYAADRHDAKLPEASAVAVRSFAAALATREDPEIRAEASLLVHLAASDAASLKAGLESCKLDGVAPGRLSDRDGMRMHFDSTLPFMFRVGLLHPCSAELMKIIERPSVSMSQMGMMLSILKDPQVRARLEPAMFLDWTRYTTRVPGPYVEGVKAYATERRNDFDEGQRTQLDALLERLENPGKEMSKELRERMQKEMREEMEKRMGEQQRWQQEMMGRPLR